MAHSPSQVILDGIEGFPLQVDSYFRVVTQMEWEVLETKARLMGGHWVSEPTAKGLLLAECYCDYYEGKRKGERDENEAD